jgi:hypothetical protein
VVALARLLSLRRELGPALELLARSGGRLDDADRRELRASTDFRPLWRDERFRKAVGEPLPAEWSGEGQGGERLVGAAAGAYTHAGELIE